TIEGYRGARLFEAVGFGPELMEFVGNCPSRIGGIGLRHVVEDAQWRLQKAEKMASGVLGRNRDYHAFNAKVRMALRQAALAGSTSLPLAENGDSSSQPEPEKSDESGGAESAYANASRTPAYQEFTKLVNNRAPTVLRDLFTIKPGTTTVPAEEVQPALEL